MTSLYKHQTLLYGGEPVVLAFSGRTLDKLSTWIGRHRARAIGTWKQVHRSKGRGRGKRIKWVRR